MGAAHRVGRTAVGANMWAKGTPIVTNATAPRKSKGETLLFPTRSKNYLLRMRSELSYGGLPGTNY